MKQSDEDQQTLGAVIQNFVSHNKLQTGLDKVEIKNVWKTVLGAPIDKYTVELYLDRDTLYVSLASSVLRAQLSYQKTEIIENINQEIGRSLIRRLVLR